MKTTIYIVLVYLTAMGSCLGQNIYDLVFFTETGEKFIVEINGVQQHELPETNIRVNGFIQPILKVKIHFENTELGILGKTLLMPETSSEVSYLIKETKRGYKIRGFSIAPIAIEPVLVAAPNQRLVVFSPNQAISQTTTVRTSNEIQNQANLDLRVGDGDVGVNVNVTIGNGDSGYYEETTTTIVEHYVMPGYEGTIGCPWPISKGDFQEALATIQSKGWDETKLSLAKQIVASNCLFADQVRDIMALMEWEESKLAFAKFAYGYTYDIGNYFKVAQSLEWEASIEELNTYVLTYRW